MIKMSQIETSFFQLQGGLDQLTPAIEMPPGRCIDAQNYEPEISGGYRRIDGFEQFDGHSSPTAADYYMFPITKSGIIIVGDTLTGASSGATCKVLSLTSGVTGSLVVGRMVGTFTSIENVTNGGIVGTMSGAPTKNAATTLSNDADFALLAANDWRLFISVVPGSGIIRGVAVYNDIVYAFRDNAAGTAGAMYKSSAAGWVQVTFGTEIQFTGAVAQVSAGNTITGATSGATATVVVAMLRSGTWTASGAGTLIITPISGTFQTAEALQVATVTKVTSSSVATSIARAAGGKVETVNYNFTGSTATLKMYGADGVNLAFEFDGTNYIPIRTGMTTDTPAHVIGYKSYLILSFLGSVQLSGIGAPYSWTAILGAAEITTGETVTGFLPNGGNATSGSALSIFTSGKTFTLYGSSSANFNLVNTNFDLGYSAYTLQLIGNNSFGMTARGIQATARIQQFGDFEYLSISHLIQPLITSKRGLETCSTTLKTKNQYRVFFSDNTGIAVGITGDEVSALMPLNYGMPVRCMVTTSFSNGAERTFFGSDDGYIYEDNTGTSFNGSTIESWLRLPFNHEKSPRVRKRWRRAVLELVVSRYTELFTTYDLGYGNARVQPSAWQAASQLSGGGAYWDSLNFIWDQFVWDVDAVSAPSIRLTGTEKNISLLFYSNRAQDKSHTIQGITMHFTRQRNER